MADQKNQLLRKVWNWIKLTSLLLGLIAGGCLLYDWWNREQKIARLKTKLNQLEQQAQERQQHYQNQQNYLELTVNLANSSNIHSFFEKLLRNYAEKFAISKQIDISHHPLVFGGFYQGEKTTEKQPLKNHFRKLGNCCFTPQSKQTIISLNQFYLLNKLGYEKYFATPEYYLEIDFANLLKTISHELAHYFQFIKHGESSCESDKGTEKYIAELAKEHKEFGGEIYGIIKQEIPEWESRWKKI